MSLAGVGVRRWADALWRLTRDVVGVGAAAAWPERLRAAPPGPNPEGEWQAALALATSSEGTPAAAGPVGPRRQAGSRGAPPDASRRERVGRSSSSSAGTQGASEGHGWVRPRERARRRLLGGDPLPPSVVAVDTPALATVLGRYARLARTDAVLSDRRPRPRGGHTAPRLDDGSHWQRGLARRTADRLLQSGGRAFGPSGSRAAFEPTIAAALARTLDSALDGVRVDPTGLFGTKVAPGARRAGEGDPAVTPTPTPAAFGDRAPVGPLRPLGLASPDSAPAPQVPVSVTSSPAGSASRVAPPTGAPSLPPLIPTAIVQPPALGVSAPSLRQATRPEDPDVEDDDHSALADRIRCILRGEARRHGLTLR